jgi:hypothetical protein
MGRCPSGIVRASVITFIARAFQSWRVSIGICLFRNHDCFPQSGISARLSGNHIRRGLLALEHPTRSFAGNLLRKSFG